MSMHPRQRRLGSAALMRPPAADTATVPPVAATELRSQFTAFKPAARRGPRPTESTNC